MTYAEFKEKFLPQLNDTRSFAGKKRLADQYLTRIGSGSGRVVYDIDGEKVLKLALNRKGVAQNEAEAGAGYYRDTQHVVTEIFDNAEDDTWLIAEKAKKVTEKRIKELTGIPSLNDLFYFLRNTIDRNNGRKVYFKLDPETEEFFWENEFSSGLIDFVVNYGQTVGDMGRPSSYGEVLRDGEPTIVLTDYGLNDEVYDTHYSPDRNKQRYHLYELFQFADGNDDILSDAGNAKDIKYGMWAQMPYSVGDGDGVINEEFVNFVNNRETYPDNPITGLPLLTDYFHECVNNLKPVLESVTNKKRFYENLLKLQEYLIRRGFYSREPLVAEKYVINEDVPDVEYNSLNDKAYSDELAREVAKKLNLNTPKYLGGGGFGFAYEINNDLVMKLTSDVSEADAAYKLIRGNPEHLSKIYRLYKVYDKENNKSYFVILQENIVDKPVETIRKMQNIITKIKPAGLDYEDILIAIRKPKSFNYDEWVKFAEKILTDNPDAGIGEADRQAAYKYLLEIFAIRQELLDYAIKSTDYITIHNLGYKDGMLKFFDIGGYTVFDEPQVPDSDVIEIDEDGTSIYSTPNSIGQDDFPSYTQGQDTEPLPNNSLDANMSLYEDLIYNHIVGSAADDQYEITERRKAWVDGSKAVTVKKNCRLGGKADGTSDACNQGDINNLEFSRLDEVGEGTAEPYEVKIIKSTADKKIYAFKTEDNDNYFIEFSRANLDDNEWDVIFGVKGEEYTTVTNKGRLYRVMATILKIMNGFFANTNPDMIVIEPIKNKSGDFRRFLLYLSYIGKNLPPEYEMVKNTKEIIIQKKDWDDKYVLNEADIANLQDLPFRTEIEERGGKIYSVGGAVRDEFLGKESKDLDILVTGVPMDELAEIMSAHGKVDAVGKQFGVLKFRPQGASEEIDVAIPRTEKATGEGGHKGFDVSSDHSLPIEKDLERRDFTINAIAKDIDGNVIDPYGGQEDLKNKVIRVVNPEAFSDDPLRMLRAVQFASRFGFNIEDQTRQMIKQNANRIKEIPPERILIEFDKIVQKGNPFEGAYLLKDLGLTPQIFNGDGGLYMGKEWQGVQTMGEFLWLTAHHLVQDIAEYCKNKLKCDIETYKELKAFQQAFQAGDNIDDVKARTFAHNIYRISPNTLGSQILPDQIKRAAQELLSGKYPKDSTELAVSGNDLMSKGLQGKEIGDALKSLLINVYADKVRNTREDLLALLDKGKDDIEEGFDYYSESPDTWTVNGQEQEIHYFVREYDKWNGGHYSDPTREAVKEFLLAKFRDLADDEKLNKYLYWQLIDRELLNENDVKRVSYSGVVLDDKSRSALLKVFAPMIPEDWETIAHHMTIKMGGLETDSQERQDMEDNKEIVLDVVDYAMDDKVLAVGVEGYNSFNQKPHITIAVNRKAGGKPVMSNYLTDWKPLGFPLKLKGKITEV